MKWEKTFEFSGPVATVWEAFTNGKATHRVWDPDNAYLSGGAIGVEWTERTTNQVLAWEEVADGKRLTRMSVTFTETETGTRISMTSEGFGALPESLHQARLRGWTEMLWDLELYFRTGQMLDRLHHRRWGRLGLQAVGRGHGLEVSHAAGVSAEAGLEPGDLLVRIGGAPVFEVGDLWLLESALPDGEITFEFFRGRELHTATATLGTLEPSRAG